MLRGLEYGRDGRLQDDTGHRWSRVKDWVEPVEAERLVREGTRLVVQRCRKPPIAERPERFKKDVRAHMLTSADADAYADKMTVPTIMVGELWSSKGEGRPPLVRGAGAVPTKLRRASGRLVTRHRTSELTRPRDGRLSHVLHVLAGNRFPAIQRCSWSPMGGELDTGPGLVEPKGCPPPASYEVALTARPPRRR